MFFCCLDHKTEAQAEDVVDKIHRPSTAPIHSDRYMYTFMYPPLDPSHLFPCDQSDTPLSLLSRYFHTAAVRATSSRAAR